MAERDNLVRMDRPGALELLVLPDFLELVVDLEQQVRMELTELLEVLGDQVCLASKGLREILGPSGYWELQGALEQRVLLEQMDHQVYWVQLEFLVKTGQQVQLESADPPVTLVDQEPPEPLVLLA